MIRRKAYKDQDRFRRYRNRYKKRYNAKRDYSGGKKIRWSTDEDKIVLAHEMTDTEIAKMLKRSINAIQVRRVLLKKRMIRENV